MPQRIFTADILWQKKTIRRNRKDKSMKKVSKFQIVMDIVLILLGAALATGIKFVFHACDKKPDGSWMSCHWAQEAVFAIALAIAAMALIRLIVRSADIKTGLSLAMIPAAIMAAVIPNNMINLCMMKDMHCHSMMRPAVIGFSAVIAAAAVISVIADRMNKERD